MISINTLNYIDIKRAFRIRCIMLSLEILIKTSEFSTFKLA